MTTTYIRPTPLAYALSLIFGRCVPQRETALLWGPCPDCERYYRAHLTDVGAHVIQPRMTICKVCGGGGRMAYL